MAGGIVNIILHATGAGQVVGEVSKSGKVIAELSGNVKKLGNVFGETGSIMSSVLSNIIKGSVWGVMAEGVRLVVHWIGKWRDTAKEAAEEAKRKTEEMIAANSKLVASIKEASAAQAAAIDHNLSRREKEIDRVKELTKAEIELARQREIAAAKGDEAGISAANSKAEKLLAVAIRVVMGCSGNSDAPGVKVVDDPLNNVYPMPLDATDKYDVLAGRIRQDISRTDKKGLDMFVSGDQLLRGAALNAVEIAEHLVARGLV